MVSSVPPPLRPAKRSLPLWVKLLCGFGVLLLVLMVAGLAAFYYYANDVHTELASVEAAVREAGYPVNAEELAAFYPEIPAEENGAPVYNRAHEALAVSSIDRRVRDTLWERVSALKTGQAIPPDLLEDMRRQTAALTGVLDLLQVAATYDRVRFPIDLTLTGNVEWSHIGELQELSQVLCIAGLVAAQDSDWSRFASLHEVRAHMAEALDEEPVLRSKLMRSHLLRMSMTELGLVFSLWPVPPETLSALAAAYQLSEDTASAAEAIAVERCAMVSMIAAVAMGQMEEDDGPFSAVQNQPGSAIGAGLVDQRTRLNIYRFSDPLVALGKDPWSAWIPKTNEVRSKLKAARYSAPLASLVMPAFFNASTAFVRSAATIRIMQTSIAVERFRAVTGALPETLEALVPEYLAEVTVDPFDGAPLRYRKEATGYTIYSVYDNLADDGGEAMVNQTPGEPSAGDWVFSVVR